MPDVTTNCAIVHASRLGITQRDRVIIVSNHLDCHDHTMPRECDSWALERRFPRCVAALRADHPGGDGSSGATPRHRGRTADSPEGSVAAQGGAPARVIVALPNLDPLFAPSRALLFR